mgnify:CR=1 FL=1
MANIQVLDQVTIDKIAAGEVIERPASIVKELVENAIDADATAVTVEIKEGGISFIRITDNGCGIPKDEVATAFLRHSTSKIRTVDDLVTVGTLGFRGEALSSIAAIAQVELITKTKQETLGTHYVIEGGVEKSLDVIGAKDGSTFLIRQIFYNTPARRKFLKTPMTEASHIHELMIRLALSHPEVSFEFINNHQSKLHTSGNGKLKDVIYQVFGRDITQNLLDVDEAISGIKVTGYIGKPLVSRGNRNYENYYINGRYVKNNIIAKAIEDAYKDFTMQHKYPFTVLHFVMEGNTLDVNVHPTKMELRFSHQQDVYNVVYQAISNALHQKELIPCVEIPEVKKVIQEESQKEEKDLNYFMKRMQERVVAYHKQPEVIENIERVSETTNYKVNKPETQKALQQVVQEPTQQLDLFQEQLLSTEKTIPHKLIGQVFDTYWLVEFQEQLYIIDQHAAHERVLYEKTLKSMKYRDYTSQYISPPIILNLSMKEADVLKQFSDIFSKIGFEIEVFGEDSYAIRAVPDNLFGIAKKELFIEMLDEISDGIHSSVAPDIISEKVASMSCKAAVKGNSKLSATEVDALINELLILDNPYHCPHGRPTIIAMTKRELEKKFKRIV